MLFASVAFLSVTATLAVALPAIVQERQAPDGAACAALELYHLAGTFESGLGSVGEAFVTSLPKVIPGASVYPVNYDTAPEYVITDYQGAQAAQSVLTARASACPDTKFVISGYSKGAQVLHETTLPSDVQAKVVAAVVFGDPNKPEGDTRAPLNNKACLFSFCNEHDFFCDPPGNFDAHLAYRTDGSTDKASVDIAKCYQP